MHFNWSLIQAKASLAQAWANWQILQSPTEVGLPELMCEPEVRAQILLSVKWGLCIPRALCPAGVSRRDRTSQWLCGPSVAITQENVLCRPFQASFPTGFCKTLSCKMYHEQWLPETRIFWKSFTEHSKTDFFLQGDSELWFSECETSSISIT